MADLVEVLKNALSLNVNDRAALAERLLASLDELDEEEAERLWAQEAQRRLEEYRAGRAGVAESPDVAKKAERLFR
jgi:putative addiction module component (TIGR02574 family)